MQLRTDGLPSPPEESVGTGSVIVEERVLLFEATPRTS